MGSLILIPTVVDPTLRKKREGWGTRRFVVHAKDGRLGLCGALGLPRVLQGSVSGPPHVVAADVVEGGGLPGLASVYAYPMQGGGAAQEHRGVGLLIGVGSWGLATAWCGSQSGDSEEFYGFASPLLVNLMPAPAVIVRAKEGAVTVQG